MVDHSGDEPDARSLGDASGNLHGPHSMKKQKTKSPASKPVPDKPNPKHKADFDGLLDMAITPPKQPRS